MDTLFSDLTKVFTWYIFVLLLGISFFPLTRKILPTWADYGWGVSKTIGILLFSYLIWLLTSLHIIRFETPFLFITLFIVLFISIYWGKLATNLKNLREPLKLIIFEELAFLVILFGWSIVRGYFPEIRGLEKFMDYGFVVSILNSSYAPPKDMWYAGSSINYYYFGHYITAVLTKLTNLPSEITYNIQIASIFATSFVGVFSLVMSLTKRIINSLISALMVCVIGNLHFLVNLPRGLQNYWYPDATRLIPYTISEYPIYSFIVADLHGHLSSLPLVIVTIGLIINFVLYNRSWLNAVILGIFIGSLYATNSWDFPIYLFLLGATLFVHNLWLKTGFIKTLLDTAVDFAKVLIVAILSYLPFITNFDPISNSIGLSSTRSPLDLLLIFWGFPLLMIMTFLIWFSLQKEVKEIEIFFTVLIFVCFVLIIFPEFFYLKDIYTVNYFRANTMFKLYYQAWIMLGIFGGWGLWKVSGGLAKSKLTLILYMLVFSFLLVSTTAYAWIATKTYYQNFKTYTGLDGLSYLKTEAPYDFHAISWVRQNTNKNDVVLEAVGDSYTNYGRVSSYSGRSTILGWPVHEWLWRGGWPPVAERQNEVADIYQSPDIERTKNLLSKYNVRFIYVGPQEKTKYTSLNETKINQIGNLVYQNEEVKIYRLF